MAESSAVLPSCVIVNIVIRCCLARLHHQAAKAVVFQIGGKFYTDAQDSPARCEKLFARRLLSAAKRVNIGTAIAIYLVKNLLSLPPHGRCPPRRRESYRRCYIALSFAHALFLSLPRTKSLSFHPVLRSACSLASDGAF